MSEWILCAIQVSVIATGTWLVGRWLLIRRPEVSAMVGVLGMGAAAVIVLATATRIPRPWTVALPVPTDDVAVAKVEDTDVVPGASRAGVIHDNSRRVDTVRPTTPATGWQIYTIAGQLRRWNSMVLSGPSKPFQWVFRVAVAICVLLLVRIVLGNLAVMRLACSSTPVRDIRCDRICREVSRRLGITEPVDVRQHRQFHSPCVSWLTPWTVYLPVGFESWTDEELSAGIAHELAHLNRRDAQVRLVSELCWTAICWNPLMLLVRRQLTLAQELAADQMAARAINSQRTYTCGLLRLALRCDAPRQRHVFASSISISSSCMIRRIKMLKGFQTGSRTASSVLRNMVCGLMLAGCGWLGCWTVQAQSTGRAGQQEPDTTTGAIRVATNDAVPAGNTPPFFARAESLPWEVLGDTDGYLSVRVAELLQHPMLKRQVPVVQAVIENTLRSADDGNAQRLADFGLSLDAIYQVDLHLLPTVHVMVPNEEQLKRGLQRGGISVGGTSQGLRIQVANEVDWPALVRAHDFSSWWPDQTTRDALLEAVENGIDAGTIAQSAEVSSAPAPRDPAATPDPLNDCQKQLWQDVNGGVVTWFIRITPQSGLAASSKAAMNDPGSTETERTWWKTALSINAVAIGLDYADGNPGESVRLSLEPAPGTTAETLASQLETFRSTLISELKRPSTEGLSESKRDELIRQVHGLEIVPVGSGDTARVRIQGAVSVAALLQME